MQIYNANRPTKPKITSSIHIKPLRSSIYTCTLVRYKHKSLKKRSNRAARQHGVPPKQEYLYTVHYQHMQMWVEGHARSEKSKEDTGLKKKVIHVKYIIQVVCV